MWTPEPRRSILPGTGRAVSRLKHLIQEIHRRSLWQVLGIYLVGASVAFQGIEALVSVLGLPIVLVTASAPETASRAFTCARLV